MRAVFLAGAALAFIAVAVNLAIQLLNAPNDWSVAAGYFLLLGLVSVVSGMVYRIGRRL